jgi:hypothetical protein
MVLISGSCIGFDDRALAGLIDQMMVLAQDAFRLQPARMMQGAQEVSEQAPAGLLSAR